MSRRMLKKTERRCRLEPIGSGCDGNGDKHPLGLVEGATENTTVVQALIDNLIERGLDPKVCRLFIIDGAKALSKVIRRTFGAHTPIQRCQIHKARNVIERLPKPLHASVRRALRQAWELDDAKRPSGCCATSPAGSTRKGPALPPTSSKVSARC
jgi:transposase-like protein